MLTYIDKIVRDYFCRKHDFDGVDMAWSHPSKRGGSRNDKRNFAELIKEYAMTYLIKLGADPNKVLLGISSSGRAFIALDVIDMSAKLPALGTKFKNYTFSGPYTEEDTGFLGYNEVCLEFKESPTKWKMFWDDFAKVPFAIHEQEFITYDNVKSIREKVKFANSKNLGGVMIWAVDTDDFRGDCYQEGDEFENYPVLRTVNEELALGKKEDYDNFLEQNDENVAAVLESCSIRLKINLFVIVNSMIAVYYLKLV
ncbi:chitinase [Holotrichia oblita]|uniref:Chitinase n=2 Tax=Holotrichia oblita TaxID=644536 RepID=A0ACB9TKV6_HOLOL|nr:chitinase [Holotrichia oblita]KAI4467439.1 chitinase [Holotrichia oblita]